MKKINVIDFDHTLLPYNSFTRFVICFARHWRYLFPIISLSFLRFTGVLSRGGYEKRILMLVRKTADYHQRVKEFSDLLARDINMRVLGFVRKNTDEGTINILCTASPEDYISLLCERLGDWICLCSTLDEKTGMFHHMYSREKVRSLAQRYPSDLFSYHLAISDSKIDLDLLRLFETAYLFRHGMFVSVNTRPRIMVSDQKG
jgi:phosphoserine phosphatase